MLQVSISGTLAELGRVFAFLATLPPDTLVSGEATDITHHATSPLITAASQPPQAAGATKSDRRRKEFKTAAPQAAAQTATDGPFSAPAPAQPAQQQTAANGSVHDVAAVQKAIADLFSAGKGGSVPGLFQEFDINPPSASNVPEDKRAAFVAKAQALQYA